MSSSEKRRHNLDAEKNWHEQKFYIDSGHWTSHPLLASRERHWLHNEVFKIRFYGFLYRYIKQKSYSTTAKILLAPVGNGSDLRLLQGIYSEIHGIDISPIALSNCPKFIISRQGDILESGYENSSFDVIVCSQFLHHVHGIGFDPFIREFFRLLRHGGTLAILEPGSMHPFGWITALARTLLGNVTKLVENERPIFPPRLVKTQVSHPLLRVCDI